LKSAKYVILGAGLAGLSAAYHLETDYLIFERENHVGGLCYSEEHDGFLLDYCVHVLYHRDTEIRKLCEKLLGDNYKDHIRSTWIYSREVFTQYPFQANLYGLPLDVVEECILGFIDAKYSNGRQVENRNFAEWIVNTFGRGIAKHFMFPFNEKLWTVHPERMSTEWVEGIVPQPEIEDIIDGALPGQKRLFGYNATFRYPIRGGIKELPVALSKEVKNIHFNHEAASIDVDRKIVYFTGSQEPSHYETLINTLPLKYFPEMIENVPCDILKLCEKLIHNSVECVNVGFNRPIQMTRHWIYYPEPEFPFYRIMLPHTMSAKMVPEGKGAFSIEVSHGNERAINPERIEEDVIEGLRQAHLLDADEEPIFIKRLSVPCAYPIYTKERPDAIAKIKDYLSQKSIYSIGRFGNWEYSNMEKALKDGRELALKLRGE
jgi:UDP-galactopyranose mutase